MEPRLKRHLICLQHICSDAACRAGLSATADTSAYLLLENSELLISGYHFNFRPSFL